MTKHSPELIVDFMPPILFEDMVDDGVKIIVPSCMPKKFHKLHTESGLKFVGNNFIDDLKCVQKKYKEHDVFALTCWERHIYPDFKKVSYTDFALEKMAFNDVVAFVCVPKGFDDEDIVTKIEDYYNGGATWLVVVIDQDVELDSDFIVDPDVNQAVLGSSFTSKDEKYFEKIKKNYGVTQKQINELKRIIQKHKKSDTKNEYIIK